MKVYQLECGETEWVAADDMLAALKYYLGLSGIHIDEIESCRELTDSELDTFKVEYPDDEDTPSKTFREAIVGIVEPEIIASTAY